MSREKAERMRVRKKRARTRFASNTCFFRIRVLMPLVVCRNQPSI